MTDVPKWLELARKEIGTRELPGPRSNPKVVQYYIDAAGKKGKQTLCRGVLPSSGLYWCVLEKNSTRSLMARSYQKYGDRCPAQMGAIAVWPRGRSPIYGHVNFVESVEGNYVTCIGGNQSDAVNRQKYDKRKAVAFRWPK